MRHKYEIILTRLRLNRQDVFGEPEAHRIIREVAPDSGELQAVLAKGYRPPVALQNTERPDTTFARILNPDSLIRGWDLSYGTPFLCLPVVKTDIAGSL